MKGRYDYLQLGTWNAMCAECGRKGKADEMVRLPQGIPGAGMYVHPEHYTARNPQDFVRGVPDKMVPPWVQPEPEPTYIEVCDLYGISCLADLAVADCSICDYVPELNLTEEELSLATDDEDILILTDTDRSILV